MPNLGEYGYTVVSPDEVIGPDGQQMSYAEACALVGEIEQLAAMVLDPNAGDSVVSPGDSGM